ncbi:MAG: asparagine synthase (glutamine-hydrolyzing) [Calditrichaeota bacterium]|nr:MAG: asparagine synthase (glutamine-hydrolyzing) [Calditrichota bacterium]
MCGIVGVFWKSKNNYSLDEKNVIIEKMNSSIYHRGPDDFGIFSNHNIQLAMRRLSIIDVKSGHQPITSSDNRYTIIFNGEIYNYLEIRKQLESKYSFKTNSDTETLLYSYIEFGEKCVEHLNGMFAFAIWDNVNKNLFVARDRLGIKPLYFVNNSDFFIFGSEIKSLLNFPLLNKELDFNSISHYLSQYVFSKPILKNIQSLLPGSYLKINKEGVENKRFWKVEFPKDYSTKNENELIDELDFLLKDSINKRLISEVPLGAFLSGGIDSSLIVSLVQKLKKSNFVNTFTVGFESSFQEFNEIEFAKETAEILKTKHHEIIITEDDVLENLVDFIWFCDQPTASGLQTFFVSKFTKNEGITVALSGLGGDELSAGYNYYPKYYFDEHKIDYLKQSQFGDLTNSVLEKIPTSKTKDFSSKYKTPFGNRYKNHRSLYKKEQAKLRLFSKNTVTKLTSTTEDLVENTLENFADESFINKLQFYDLTHYLPFDPLKDSDIFGMASSIEIRVPFLDHRIVEFFLQLPTNKKFQKDNTKYLLKKVAERYVSREILDRKKQGFEFPLKYWVDGKLRFVVEKTLSKESVESRGIFNYSEIQLIQKEFNKTKDRINALKLWSLTILELWFRIHLDRKEAKRPDFTLVELLDFNLK